MSKDHLKAITELRHAGYAVIVWTPEELQGLSSKHVEDRSVELGYEVINEWITGETP